MQDHLERAFERVTGGAVRVHGAGRTDAGVHALAQCAHVDVLKFLPADRWIKALNALLPSAVRVLRCRYLSQNFHARLSAKGKIYRYRIWTAPILPPFEYRRAWHIAQPLDLKILKSAAKHFVGTHDFAAFAANRGKPEPSTIRTINSVRVRQKGPCVTIEFDGDGFLYKMVRLMVGALVKCALGKMRVEEITVATALRQNRLCPFRRARRRIVPRSRALLTIVNAIHQASVLSQMQLAYVATPRRQGYGGRQAVVP